MLSSNAALWTVDKKLTYRGIVLLRIEHRYAALRCKFATPVGIQREGE